MGRSQSSIALPLGLTVLFVFLLLMLASIVSISTGKSSWKIEVVDNEVDIGMYTSIALDTNDNPHILYQSGRTLKYTSWTGSTWEVGAIDSDRWWDLDGVSLALDVHDNPHIAYVQLPGPVLFEFEPVPTSRLKYAKRTPVGWSIEIVDNAGVGPYPSLALDENGNPHISYYGGDNLKYAKWTGSAWDIQTIDDNLGVGRRSFSSLAFDGGSRPHIIYYDESNGVIKHASWNGENWLAEVIDNVNSLVILSSAFDSNWVLHTSYFDGMNGKLKHAMRTSAGWLLEEVDSVPPTLVNSGLCVMYHSIAVDANNNPHISYFKYEYDGKRAIGVLKYAKRSVLTWEIETIDNNLVTFPSIAVNGQGNPHISYGGKYAVLKFQVGIGLLKLTLIALIVLVAAFLVATLITHQVRVKR